MTNPSHTLALEEMRLEYQQVSQSSDVLDNKASAMLGASSLILGLLGVLQISAAAPSFYLQIGKAVIAFLYLLMLALTIKAIFPRTFHAPIKADWTVLSDHLLTQNEQDATLKLISGYVEQIEYNKTLNENKSRNLEWSARIFGAIIFLLLILSIWG